MMKLDADGLAAVVYLVRHHRSARLPVPPRVALLAKRVEFELRCSASGTDNPAAVSRWIGTKEAAVRLGCSERWARHLAPGLGGQKIAGRWLLPEDSV